MRTIKVVGGVVCLVAALLPALESVVWFDGRGLIPRLTEVCIACAFTACACGLVGSGLFLIAARRLPLSKNMAVLIGVSLSAGIFPAIGTEWFVRAHSITAREACLVNLRQIEGAKQQWALEARPTNDSLPGTNQSSGKPR